MLFTICKWEVNLHLMKKILCKVCHCTGYIVLQLVLLSSWRLYVCSFLSYFSSWPLWPCASALQCQLWEGKHAEIHVSLEFIQMEGRTGTKPNWNLCGDKCWVPNRLSASSLNNLPVPMFPWADLCLAFRCRDQGKHLHALAGKDPSF